MFGNVAIGITSDYVDLEEHGKDYIKKGGLVVIDPKEQSVKALPITNFPEDVAFHPHGLFIFENLLLYVVNHAYEKGGERVEVFSLLKKPVTATYMYSIQFPDDMAGSLNDLVVMSEDKMYIT